MSDAPSPLAFDSLALPSELLKAVEVLGFREMTPIQRLSLPLLIEGRDVIARAQTGSGKTVAFGLAALQSIDLELLKIQVLILCPTRELADQVSGEMRKIGSFLANLRVVTLCGGVPLRSQRPSLAILPHVVVGTPGRILDHLTRNTMSLTHLRVLVLDEADRMLDMGFFDEIAQVVEQAPKERQTLLFSATYPEGIRRLSNSLQKSAEMIVAPAATDHASIEQIFYWVDEATRYSALVNLLLHYQPENALLFCNTRSETKKLQDQLHKHGFSALALHGDLEQRERDEVLLRFANGSARILVATDVAARGLDIKELELVVAWELAIDPHVHLHRIGRTGRAGNKGRAIALCSKRDREAIAEIELAQNGPVKWGKLPAPSRAQPAAPSVQTLILEGGKQDKLRPGDILGALTGDVGLTGADVGKIIVTPRRSYVAIASKQVQVALVGLQRGKIKGRTFRVSRFG